MFVSDKSSRKASARNQIDIKGVQGGVLILHHNQFRAILSVSPVNFELKSEDERDAIIDTYESFLNSVGCPLQILVRTREIDMDKYLDDLGTSKANEKEKVYRDQLENYGDFIKGLIESNKILTRNFYVVVPYNLHGKLDFDGVKEQLILKLDIVRKGLARLGMSSRKLDDLEILDLFYSFYSPEQSKLQPLSSQALALLHTEYIRRIATNE
jgi:TraC protein